ncbi:hypothetical protein [Streptomyces xantholiticus]|uniref:hypothetical protein n=1 Tax=Streptomyces xantholiticus TaxID=68285 RepID=UPI00167B9935|nr:hypothetical protein [Streptomyces xantholiticus]GGW73591.1 hypothetical protein GCM10010381_67890 [Streptomyces xantholiticus]
MTLQIAPEAALILIIGCVVGFAVFKHTARTHTGTPTRGDLVGSIGAAVGVITVLALLLGMGVVSEAATGPAPVPDPVSTESRSP